MYVKHNSQEFEGLRTSFKDPFIDYTFIDESIIELKIINFI